MLIITNEEYGGTTRCEIVTYKNTYYTPIIASYHFNFDNTIMKVMNCSFKCKTC